MLTINLFYFILHLGQRLRCWVECTSFSTSNAQNHISMILTAFSLFSQFSSDCSKTLRYSTYIKIFSDCWEHPASSSTLVLVQPLKINHLLKANSFVPCLSTLVSHLDDKESERAGQGNVWNDEECLKKQYLTECSMTHSWAPTTASREQRKKLGRADLGRVTMTFFNCCWRTAQLGSSTSWRCLLLAETAWFDRQSLGNKSLKFM